MTGYEERRDVARRLRNLDDERIAGKLALNGTWVFADVLDEALFGKRIFKIQKHGLGYITSKLADLIDPDCRHESYCEVCGHVIPDGCGECPRCRSKVMPDDNR